MLQKKVLKQKIIWSWSPLKKRMKTNYISNKRAVVKNCHIHKKYEADVVGSWTRI